MFLWDPTDDSLGWWWSYPLSWGHCSAVFQLSVVWFISMVLISFSPQHAHILISSWCRSSLKDSVHVMVLSWAKWTFVLPLYIFVWTITTSSSPRHKWYWGGLFYAPEFSLANHWNQATGEQNALQEKARTEAGPSMARRGYHWPIAIYGSGQTGVGDKPWDTITRLWPLWWEIPTTGYGSTVLCQDVLSKYIIYALE